jgi:hypothetical protein
VDEMVAFELRGRPMRLSRRRVEGFLRSSPPGLCVDLGRRVAYLGGAWLDLRTMTIPFRILTAVARDQGTPVGAHRLFQEVWGRPPRTRYDLSALRLNVWNLRRTLRQVLPDLEILETDGGGYRVKREILVSFILPLPVQARVQGDTGILDLARREGSIDNRKLQAHAGCSRSTAGRILDRLEKQGLLQRVGAGRTTAYRVREGLDASA